MRTGSAGLPANGRGAATSGRLPQEPGAWHIAAPGSDAVTQPPSAAAPSRPVRLAGVEICVADDKPTFWARAAAGDWEPETLAALAEATGHGVVVLDIGAWVGPTTLFAAARGARVLAVEADPAALLQLAANIAANPTLSPRIRVLARAAAPEPGMIRLGPARKPGDSMSSILHAGREGAWEVEVATPAGLMAAVTALGDGPLTVKIDIEGGEYALLPPLVAALPERATTLLCAFHPRILAATGVDAATIAARTDSCLEALRGWSVQLLDDLHPVGTLSTVLTTRNTTVLCTRRS